MRVNIISGKKGTGKTTLARQLAGNAFDYLMICDLNAQFLRDYMVGSQVHSVIFDLINPFDQPMLEFIRDVITGDESNISPVLMDLFVIFEDVPTAFTNLPNVNYMNLVLDEKNV